MSRANEIMEMLESVLYIEEDYELDEEDINEGDTVYEYKVVKNGKVFIVPEHKRGEKVTLVPSKDKISKGDAKEYNTRMLSIGRKNIKAAESEHQRAKDTRNLYGEHRVIKAKSRLEAAIADHEERKAHMKGKA